MKRNILHLKRIKHFLKVTNIAFLTFSLIVAPSTLAQGSAPPTAMAAGVGAAIQNVTMEVVSAMSQQGPVVPQQVAKVPSKLFPGQCMVLPARTNLPVGACEGQLPVATRAGDFMGRLAAVQQVGQSTTIAQMAQGKILSIDTLINLDTNNPATNEGLACLHREAKELQDQFTKKQQELEALIGRIDLNNKAFIEQNEARVSAMADNAYLLYGTNFRGKANAAHLKLKDSFSQGCQEIIGLSALGGVSNGLDGLNQELLTPVAQASTLYQRNQPDYERQIREQVSNLLNDFEEYGIASYDPSTGVVPGRGQIKFKGIDAVIAKESEKLMKKYQTYQRIIADYNIADASLPALDHKFESELERLSQNASNLYLQQAVDDCMSGRDRSVSALTTEQIIQNLNYIPTDGTGSTLESYATSLRSILNSDRTMRQKIEEIRLLDARIGGNVQISMHHFDGSNGSVTPYQLYNQQLDLCEAQLTQPGEAGQLSLQEKVEETQRLINEIKADKDRFVRNIDNQILDEVINCSNAPMAAGACTVAGAETMLNPAGDNFCIAHASQCSTDLKACHKEAEDEIKVKKDHTAILAEEYNNNFVALVAQQNQLAQQVQANILSLAEMVNQMIPGTAWEFQGESLALTPPKPELVGELGVHLRGAGDFESIDQLKERIRQMKQLLQDQSQKVEREVNDYIALQEDNMQEAKKDWEELAEKCNQQIAEARQRQGEMEAQQNQALAEANGFCTDYNRAAAQPSCGRVSSLAGASIESAGSLVGAAHSNAQAVERDFCPDGNDGGDDEGATQSIPELASEREQTRDLAQACEGNNASTFRSTALRNLERNLPQDLVGDWDAIQRYASGETDQLPSSVSAQDSFLRTHIEPLREALAEAEETDLADEFSGDLLTGISNDDLEEYLGSEAAATDVRAILTATGDISDELAETNSNFCLRLRLQALESAAGGDRTPAQVIDRAGEMLEGDRDLSNAGIREVARGIASVDRTGRRARRGNVTNSSSFAMGQQLRSVPCTNLAGQGNFNTGRVSPFQAQQDRILGPGNSGNLINTTNQ